MNIIKNRMIYFIISIVIILIGAGFMTYNASNGNGLFNFDIQFTGGTSFEADLGKDFENSEIEDLVNEVVGEKGQVQKVGSNGQTVSIKTKFLEDDKITEFKTKLCEKYGISVNDISDNTVGATILVLLCLFMFL